jgi:hypothetical protein
LFPFGPLFLNYGVRILYLFISDAVCFVGVDLCVYKRRRRKRRDVVHCKTSSLVFLCTAVGDQYNAPENDACVLA